LTSAFIAAFLSLVPIPFYATRACQNFSDICSIAFASVVKNDYTMIVATQGRMIRPTRPISWIKSALKDFEKFPADAQSICLAALTIAAEGGKADIAKPLLGLGTGVLEIALPFKGNAYRVVYAVQIGRDLWVIHAFQKKSTKGAKTPDHEIELIRTRLKGLKEMLA
jgi:phage-related protein